MSGWLLIIILLLLGGILSTLGDRLGSRVGKARLSIFKLRPKSTAILITVFTGSFISAISLGVMIISNKSLRVGLFQLEAIQKKINTAEKELKMLERNLYAFRSGDVVIASGQSLVQETIQIENSEDIKKVIDSILQKANNYAFNLARPGERPNKMILRVRKDYIANLEKLISDKRKWVISIISAGNILRGENYVFAFPEAHLNKSIVRKGDEIAKTLIDSDQLDAELINKKIKLLLDKTLAEVKSRGSLSSRLKLNAEEIYKLGEALLSQGGGEYELKAIATSNSDSADKVSISLEIVSIDKILID